MTDLNQALIDIRNIRRQVAHATEFRGYGPLTLSVTAVFAILGGVAQHLWLPEPATRPAQYVAIWLVTGILSAGLIITQMLTRADRLHSGMADEMICMAVAQFCLQALRALFYRLSCCASTATCSGCCLVSGKLSLVLASSLHVVVCRGPCSSPACGFFCPAWPVSLLEGTALWLQS